MPVAYLRGDSIGNRNDPRRIKSGERESPLKGAFTVSIVYAVGSGAPSCEDGIHWG